MYLLYSKKLLFFVVFMLVAAPVTVGAAAQEQLSSADPVDAYFGGFFNDAPLITRNDLDAADNLSARYQGIFFCALHIVRGCWGQRGQSDKTCAYFVRQVIDVLTQGNKELPEKDAVYAKCLIAMYFRKHETTKKEPFTLISQLTSLCRKRYKEREICFAELSYGQCMEFLTFATTQLYTATKRM